MRKTWVRAKHGDKNLLIHRGHAWKTGARVLCGYRLVWDSERRTYVREHRLIYERHYKCCLLRWISIHHIDGNRLNNEISNLCPMTSSAHTKLEGIKGDHSFKKGNIPWNKGKTLSQEIRQKISAANTGLSHGVKGVCRSEETKRKISAALMGHPNWRKAKS